jgi:hypothetical protein
MMYAKKAIYDLRDLAFAMDQYGWKLKSLDSLQCRIKNKSVQWFWALM